MPLQLVAFAGLPAFMSDFSLQQNQAAALFARSARTLRRWTRRGRAPQGALDLVRILREQRAPLSPSYAREGQASSSDWTARLARPRPAARRRRRLVSIAQAYAANRLPERAAECLRQAWPASSSSECWHAAVAMCDDAEGARVAAVERYELNRQARRAAYMRAHRRRR
jgi:hypothetical protein